MSSHALRTMLGVELDAIALNQDQERRIFNPSPEVDSLSERLAALRRHRVPAALVDAIAADVRALYHLNHQEGDMERIVAGHLDQLAAAQHAAETCPADGTVVSRQLGVKSLARALSPHLRTLRDEGSAEDSWAARRELRAIARRVTVAQLRSTTLRHELGANAHDALLSALEDESWAP